MALSDDYRGRFKDLQAVNDKKDNLIEVCSHVHSVCKL
jgi:hypothetical protein